MQLTILYSVKLESLQLSTPPLTGIPVLPGREIKVKDANICLMTVNILHTADPVQLFCFLFSLVVQEVVNRQDSLGSYRWCLLTAHSSRDKLAVLS